MSKTKEEIAQSIIDLITAARPDIDTAVGSVTRDISVDPISQALELAYQELENIRISNSVNYINQLNSSQIDDIVANRNLIRSTATSSSGTVTFYKTTVPSVDITIPAGTSVSTVRNADGTYFSFSTSTSVTLTTTTQPNVNTGYYEVSVTVTSDSTGTGNNVAANAIKTFTSISGIDGVYNQYAFSNATDVETDAALIARYIIASQTSNIGTAPGYETLVKAQDSVIDAKVVTSADEGHIRAAYGNEVDIVVRGSVLANAIQPVLDFDLTDGLTVTLLDYLPVDSIVSVVGSTLTFIEDTDFIFLNDTATDYKGTYEANDRIAWLPTGTKPQPSEAYTITLSYNKLISDIQTITDSDDYKLIGSDVLIREAEAAPVNMSFTAYVYSSTDKVYAKSYIETLVTTYINSLEMGTALEQSDLDFYIRTNASFVDKLVLPFTLLEIDGTPNVPVVDLSINKLQYYTLNTLTVAVV